MPKRTAKRMLQMAYCSLSVVASAASLMAAFVAGGYVLMAVEYLPFRKKGE